MNQDLNNWYSIQKLTSKTRDIKSFLSLPPLEDQLDYSNEIEYQTNEFVDKAKVYTSITNISINDRRLVIRFANGLVFDCGTVKGEKIILRKTILGIEYKYENESDEQFKILVPINDILYKFENLTDEQKEQLKFHFSDFTEDEIKILQKPALDVVIVANGVIEEAKTQIKNISDLSKNINQLNNQISDAEDIRNNNEAARQTNDENREKRTNSAIEEINNVKELANTATGKANTAAEKANNSAGKANTAAQNADEKAAEAKTQADYAKMQGDFAEKQGNKVNQYNSRITALEELKIDGGYAEKNMLYLTVDGVPVGDPIPVGSGGGGGGGTGGGGVLMKVRAIGEILISAIQGGTLRIGYNFVSTYMDDQSETGDGTATYTINSQKVATEAIVQGDNYFDVTKYLVLGTNKVKVTVLDSTGQSRSLLFTVEVISLSLSDSYDDTQINKGEITYRYTPSGAIAKTVHFILDGKEIGTEETTVSNRQLSFVIPTQSHGAHRLISYMTATVNGVEVRSNELAHDLICTTAGNNTIIVASSFNQTTAQQYDRLSIPFVVYNPAASTSAVTLSVNGEVLSEQTVDRTKHEWNYRIIQPGALALKIASGDVSRTFNLDVSEAGIIVEPETADLSLFLTAANRSNNDNNKEEWKFNDITANLSDFNYKTNGWINENGSTVLRVSGDARVAIPYHIFANDFRASGKTIEFEFETRDVIDYDAVVIDCLAGGIGLQVTAQEAIFKSEQTTVSTRFKEEERVRVSFVVEKKTDYRLIYIYINGILSGVAQYPNDDNFQQAIPADIVIGSNDCTVDLYNIRIYDNNLTQYQLLDNFIADIDDYDEKITVYDRNQVYTAYGDISYDSTLNRVPGLIIVGELPTYKGDKKTVTLKYTDKLHPERSFVAYNVQIDVQGTSSQYYPRKNFKFKLKNGIIISESGEEKEAYPLRPDGIPAKVFCTKADFAESSGTHNTGVAVIADKLLKDLNILTPPQKVNDKVRTTIDGFPICIFHRVTDDADIEFVGKYNFNYDKSAEETFGFADGDESWEFRNNTSDRVLFKSADFTGTDWTNDFEARYPDDDVINAEYEAGTRKPTKLMAIMEWVVSTANDTDKFKAEVADHFDLNNLLSYYLITEIFAMVDQRAKNMFLTRYAADGKWRFILYDNDTCLGINNEGLISFGYNVEYHDKIGTLNVWNGEGSVLWKNVETCFPAEIEAMYKDIRSKGYLSYDYVMSILNGEQSDKWCEAIYNADGKFKYVDPLINDGNGSYLYAAQGSRKEHRKWWAYNRFLYMDSKYTAGDFLSDYATLRLYTPTDFAGVTPSANFNIVPFADEYVRVKYGSYIVGQRCTKDELANIVAPDIQFNDTETIVYGASRIKSLGDLSGMYAGTIDVSKATRLSELLIGSSAEGYHNDNLTVLAVGANKMLRKLDIRNCPNLTQAVDLSGCENIEEVYAQGTGITSVVLPPAGILSKLYLPGTITNLSLKNQPKLLDAFFELASVEKLSTIVCESTPGINIFPIVDRCLSMKNPALSRVRLIDINATGANLDILYKLIRLGGVDEKGNNVPTAVVTGKFHATTAVENKLDAIRKAFPELTITYTNLKPPVITTFVFKSSQSKSITNSTLECNYDFEKVNEYTYKITAENDSTIEFTFRCDNHEDYSDSYLVYNTRTQEYTVTYIPLRKIRVQVYGQSIYVANARITIGEDVYITDADGYATLKRGGEAVSGTVSASGYVGDKFSLGTITSDITHTVYVYAVVEVTFIVKNGKKELVEGATVTCDGKSATTNTYGECVLLIGKGSHKYTVSYPDYVDNQGFISVGTSAMKTTIYTSLLITFRVIGNYSEALPNTTIKINEKEFITDETGIVIINLPNGDHTYTCIKEYRNSVTGEISVNNSNRSESVVLRINIFDMVPKENGNIQLLVYTRYNMEIDLIINSNNTSPIINWGDGEKTVVSSLNTDEHYLHVYDDINFYQIEIENCTEVTIANTSRTNTIVAYFSIGDSKVKNLKFQNWYNIMYIGDVFKYDKDILTFNSSFSNDRYLEYVDISSLINCTEITDLTYTFLNCESLKTIDLSPLKNNTKVTSLYGLFMGCSKLESIDLSPFANMTEVTDAGGLLQGCSKLESIDLSPFANMTKLVKINGMFRDAYRIVELDLTPLSNLPNITNIDSVCYNCAALTSIKGEDFKNVVKAQNDYAFYNCKKLKKINIFSKLTSIDVYTYGYLLLLQYAIISNPVPPTIKIDTFISLPLTCYLYAPDESVEAYKTATNWSALADRIKPISDFATDFPGEELEW